MYEPLDTIYERVLASYNDSNSAGWTFDISESVTVLLGPTGRQARCAV